MFLGIYQTQEECLSDIQTLRSGLKQWGTAKTF